MVGALGTGGPVPFVVGHPAHVDDVFESDVGLLQDRLVRADVEAHERARGAAEELDDQIWHTFGHLAHDE